MMEITQKMKPVDVLALQEKIERLHQEVATQRALLVKIDASYASYEAAGKTFYALDEDVMEELQQHLYLQIGVPESLQSLHHIQNQGVIAFGYRMQKESERLELELPEEANFYRRVSECALASTQPIFEQSLEIIKEI